MKLNSHYLIRKALVPANVARSISSNPEVAVDQQQQQQQDEEGEEEAAPGSLGRARARAPAGDAAGRAAAAMPTAPLASRPTDQPRRSSEVQGGCGGADICASDGTGDDGDGRFELAAYSVPEEGPPADRHGKSRWPQGWAPAEQPQPPLSGSPAPAAGSGAVAAVVHRHSTAACAAAAVSSGSGQRPQGGQMLLETGLPRQGSGHSSGCTVGSDDDAVQALRDAQVLALGRVLEPGQPCVLAGWGSARRVVCEQEIFELLGLPYRPPHERDIPC